MALRDACRLWRENDLKFRSPGDLSLNLPPDFQLPRIRHQGITPLLVGPVALRRMGPFMARRKLRSVNNFRGKGDKVSY